jgi:hypothetical protein
MFVSVVSVLQYIETAFFGVTIEPKLTKTTETNQKIRLLYRSGTASGFVNKIHGSGSQGLKNLPIGGSRSSSGRRQFNGIVL